MEDIRTYKISRAVETEEIIYRTGREEGTMIQKKGQRKTRSTNTAVQCKTKNQQRKFRVHREQRGKLGPFAVTTGRTFLWI